MSEGAATPHADRLQPAHSPRSRRAPGQVRMIAATLAAVVVGAGLAAPALAQPVAAQPVAGQPLAAKPAPDAVSADATGTGTGTSTDTGTEWTRPFVPPELREVLNPFAVSMLADSVPASPVENAEGLWGQAGPFYDEPPIDDSMPMGHLLNSEPFEVIYNGIKPAHIRAWRTMYVTEDVAGNRVISTGVIMVPDDGRDDASRPVVAYQQIDDSAGAKCHPSSQWTGGDFMDFSSFAALGPLAQFLGEGAAVVISDVGNDADPGVHTVFAGRYAGMALLNGLRAAYDVPGAGVNPNNDVGVFGVAGGGVGAAFAIEYQPWYAPEIPVTATLLEAMAVDQRTFIDFADGHLGSGFVLATLVGLEPQYPEMRLNDKLNPAGRFLADIFRDACQTPFYYLTPFLPQHTLFTSGIPPADEPDFQHVFRDNSLGISNPTADPALRPPGKVLVTSCAADDSIMVVTPAQDARNLVDSYRAQGVDVHYHGLDCGPGVMITDLYRWMTELFGMHAVNWLMDEIR